MYRIIDCITQEHNHSLMLFAALVCIVGSCISVLLSRRLVRARGQRKKFQLILTSLLAGTTVWSTHFISMLAYEPGHEHSYETLRTALSLGVAIFGMLAAFYLLMLKNGTKSWVFGGVIFGLTVSSMHYIGMSAYLLPGRLIWDPMMVVVSIILGALFGAMSFNRVLFPTTRYCWLGATILMVLAICSMHFAGMSAFQIELGGVQYVPEQAINDRLLSLLVIFVTGVIFLFGFASFSIEKDIANEALSKLRFAALHDVLTGLPNRMRLHQKVDEYSAELENNELSRVAVLTIDLNLFKEVNDLHGHQIGDVVLKTVSNRLANALQPDEFLARTGGDEFVALKHDFRRVEQVLAFSQRLHALIVEPIDALNVSVVIGAAIGIATNIEDGNSLSELIHKSDLAMYRAKAQPETHISFYNAQLDQQNQARLLLIDDLRQALDRDEFELNYQLQNDVRSLEPVGFEALLRWNHPERGRISPSEFIPLAEETGLIREIGLWVMRTACLEAATWAIPYNIAVNVAPQQLVQASFVESVSDILIETGLTPERLEVEITEATIIDDQAHTLSIMHKLRSMGVRIAMDDFGTGYSSLATLQTFPFDKIKIDRSFIHNVHQNHQSAAIVRSTLILGEALSIPVLAEGVEDQADLEFLRLEKCNSVQGFYFGVPMSRAEVQKLVNKSKFRDAS